MPEDVIFKWGRNEDGSGGVPVRPLTEGELRLLAHWMASEALRWRDWYTVEPEQRASLAALILGWLQQQSELDVFLIAHSAYGVDDDD